MGEPSGVLCEPLVYEEVSSVCVILKTGICGVKIDYENICFAGPPPSETLVPVVSRIFHLFERDESKQ